MAEWKVANPIDYSADGDDIDRFSLKTKQELELLYSLLQRLRTFFAGEGTSGGDTEPCEMHVDTSSTPATILMRSPDNTKWFTLGFLQDSMGLSANSVAAVARDPDHPIGSLMYGAVKDIPVTGSQGDFYFAKDTNQVYIRRGSSWQLFVSLNIDDIKGAVEKFLLREEVAENGAGMVPRLTGLGKGNFDIVGSPDKILGREVNLIPRPMRQGETDDDYDEIDDDQVLAYDANTGKWKNKARNDFRVSQQGGASSIVVTDTAGKAHVDITGSPDRIGNIPVALTSVRDDDVIAYDRTSQMLVNRPRMDFPASQTGAANAFVVADSNGQIHINTTGSAAAIDGVTVNTAGISEGMSLEYDSVNRSLKAVAGATRLRGVPVSVNGLAKGMSLEYDGSQFAPVVGATQFRGVPIDVSNLHDGDVLMYDGLNKKFSPIKKDALTEADVTSTGEPNKIVRLDNAGLIHAKFRDLEASSLNGYAIKMDEEPADGQVLTYRKYQGGWKAEDANVPIGNGRSLVLRNGNELLVQYNGMSAVEYDIGKIIMENSIDFTPYALNVDMKKYLRYVTAGADGDSFTLTSSDSSTSKTIRITKTEYATRALADKDGTHFDTGYAKLTGGEFVGEIRAPKPNVRDNSTLVATTSWVNEVIAANLNTHASSEASEIAKLKAQITTLQQQVATLQSKVS